MARTRSPNYPVIDLAAAVEAVRPVFAKEVRNKMSRLVLAKHLGYASLNGRSLGMIGAVRAYGLIEGSADEQRVSDDAISVISAPANSSDRREAIIRCALRPPLFKELSASFANTPSEENLKYELIKRGFTPEAAGKAAEAYLNTLRLVGPLEEAYNPPSPANKEDENTADEIEVGDLIHALRNGERVFQTPVRVRAVQEHDGEIWVMPDATDSWFKMDDVTLEAKGAPRSPMPPPRPAYTPLDAKAGVVVRTAIFPLPEGDVTITYPATLSDESLALMAHFMSPIVKNLEWAKKAAPILYPDSDSTGGERQ